MKQSTTFFGTSFQPQEYEVLLENFRQQLYRKRTEYISNSSSGDDVNSKSCVSTPTKEALTTNSISSNLMLVMSENNPNFKKCLISDRLLSVEMSSYKDETKKIARMFLITLLSNRLDLAMHILECDSFKLNQLAGNDILHTYLIQHTAYLGTPEIMQVLLKKYSLGAGGNSKTSFFPMLNALVFKAFDLVLQCERYDVAAIMSDFLGAKVISNLDSVNPLATLSKLMLSYESDYTTHEVLLSFVKQHIIPRLEEIERASGEFHETLAIFNRQLKSHF